ncbi:MAG: CPBP family intramembrane metalloprotease [Clostridia bacterium]|nr:CPBP family intramembrane metalloprotease [Clostridia bacterium]
MKKSKPYYLFLALAAVVFIASLVLYYIPQFVFIEDETVNELIFGVLIRGSVSVLLILLALGNSDGYLLAPNRKELGKNLLLFLPCFAVAVVNFPFSALISGSASIDRPELIWLFFLSCLTIGVSEEIFFRGLLQTYLSGVFKNSRIGIMLTVIVTAAAFALWHLFNAFTSSLGSVLYQVSYTFLLGGMLSALMLMTKDIWLCVTFHTLFDFGGHIVNTLGHGAFQDTVFWILTYSVGILCGAYIVYNLIRLQFKKKSDEK